MSQQFSTNRGPEKGEGYGMAAIAQALHGLNFPAKKEAVLQHIGDQQVEYYKGKCISLRKLIEQCRVEEFSKPTDVVEAVKDVAESEAKLAA